MRNQTAKIQSKKSLANINLTIVESIRMLPKQSCLVVGRLDGFRIREIFLGSVTEVVGDITSVLREDNIDLLVEIID